MEKPQGRRSKDDRPQEPPKTAQCEAIGWRSGQRCQHAPDAFRRYRWLCNQHAANPRTRLIRLSEEDERTRQQHRRDMETWQASQLFTPEA